MRSWIFVIGVATMGVASVIGFYTATMRLNQRVELIAERPGRDTASPLLPKEAHRGAYYARVVLLNCCCASCHSGVRPASVAPIARPAPQTR